MLLKDAAKYLHLVQAAAEGKTIQMYCGNKNWKDYIELEFGNSPEYYRIKPEPHYRPWKPEEVPMGALIRGKSNKSGISMITSYCNEGIELCDSTNLQWRRESFEFYLQDAEHSIDNGKTWNPCGVLEE